MTTQTEALKLALEALESSNKLINGAGNHFGLEGAMDGYYSGCFDVDGNNKLLNKAITAIKEALAQPEQDPIGQLCEEFYGRGQVMWFNKPVDGSYVYTTPPQRTWVGLTDEEMYRYCPIWLGQADFKALMLHIESKLKDKNND